MEVIDQPAIENVSVYKYAGFWNRFGALLIDGLVLAPVTVGISYFNAVNWKSVELLVLLSLVGIIYKPIMEFKYGATLGKMSMRMKVVNLEYGQPSLTEVLLRNVFHLFGSFFTLIFTIFVFLEPEFENVDGFFAYTTFISTFAALQSVTRINGLISIIDGIMLIADKQSRSLHDRIGKTYVIIQ
jgi:uncharacterized RDD family membrane protein YckC